MGKSIWTPYRPPHEVFVYNHWQCHWACANTVDRSIRSFVCFAPSRSSFEANSVLLLVRPNFLSRLKHWLWATHRWEKVARKSSRTAEMGLSDMDYYTSLRVIYLTLGNICRWNPTAMLQAWHGWKVREEAMYHNKEVTLVKIFVVHWAVDMWN